MSESNVVHPFNLLTPMGGIVSLSINITLILCNIPTHCGHGAYDNAGIIQKIRYRNGEMFNKHVFPAWHFRKRKDFA